MKHKIQKPQLTISLLASNRPDTIRRCLDSLHDLMEAVPSELILVDTSKNSEIHEILLEYTDQVYEFEWCNDFAKARNVGLKKAKGEWFMFLDDDEWLVDVEEIIRFFRSSDYNKYACVDHRIRNFLDVDFKRYSECWVTRLYKIVPGSEFRSKVHEYYAPLEGVKKRLYALSYHSGYAFVSKEEQEAHFKRNSLLLFDMIKQEPTNIRWKMQLIQEYASMDKWEELENYCKENIEQLNASQFECVDAEACSIFAGYVYALGMQEKHEQAIEFAQKILCDQRCVDVFKWQLQYRLTENYFNLGNWNKAIKYGNAFLRLSEDEKKRDEVIRCQNRVLMLGETFDEARITKTYAMLIACDLKSGSVKLLKENYDKLQWKTAQYMIANKVTQYFVDAIGMLEYDPIFVQLVTDAYENRSLRVFMSLEAERWKGTDKKIYDKIIAVYAQVDSDDEYIKRAKVLDADRNNQLEALDEALREYFVVTENALSSCKISKDLSEKRLFDIYAYWNCVSAQNWKLSVRKFFARVEKEEIDNITLQIQRIFEKNNWRRLFYEMALARWTMEQDDNFDNIETYVNISYQFYGKYYREEDEIIGADYEQLIRNKDAAREALLANYGETYESLESRFHCYMVGVLEYYLTIFRDEAFEGEMEALPPEACAAVWLNEFFGMNELDWEGRICALKEAGKACVSLGEKIKTFAKLMGERKRLKEPINQLQQMIDVMKIKIKQLSEQGMREEALDILRQVRKLSPDDEELLEMEKELQ